MFKYVSVKRRNAWLDEDVYFGERITMDVYERDAMPVSTGLLDADGSPIYREVERLPIGFQPPRVRVRVRAGSAKQTTGFDGGDHAE